MKTSLLATIVSVLIVFTASIVSAHCDSLDGPVVTDAKAALKKGDVTPVLKWVNKDGEKEIRDLFAVTLKVRSLSQDARDLADNDFFETLVRVHRTGEGFPFTGLKPAGTADPGLVAADKALAAGSADGLSDEVAEAVRDGIRKRYAVVLEKKRHADDSIEAGRAFVSAYVDYAHYVEALHSLISGSSDHQLHEQDK